MSTKGTIEAFVRDKLGITAIVLLLVFDAMGDVETLHKLLRLFALVLLVVVTLYENHRHIERMGNVQKSKDLILEFKDHMNKELARFDAPPNNVEEVSEEETPHADEFINAVAERFMNWLVAESLKVEPESKVEEVNVGLAGHVEKDLGSATDG